ncbi:MAG: hypothetical protein J0G34_06915 [Afipia sp.]|nr:hypothetical protein [Afipia sp.]
MRKSATSAGMADGAIDRAAPPLSKAEFMGIELKKRDGAPDKISPAPAKDMRHAVATACRKTLLT